MSQNTLSVDLDAMSAVARVFSAASTNERGQVEAVVESLKGAGAPWGGDAAGQAFWARYGSGALEAMDSLQQLRLQVQALATNTEATVVAYGGTEAANTGAALSVKAGDKELLQ